MIAQLSYNHIYHSEVVLTDLTFVPCWNFDVHKIDEHITYQLKPFDHSKFTATEKEQGTKRMGFEFLRAKTQQSGSNHDAIVRYIFRTSTD